MSWSSRRKTIYAGIFLIILFLVFGLFFKLFLYKTPTCFDGKKNQNEQEVDCGGVCPNVCDFEATKPVVLWSRAFRVSEGNYNALALIENPNIEMEAKNVNYSFKLYDRNNILIYERLGRVDILPRMTQPIFERTIPVGERVPFKAFFEFVSQPEWVKTKQNQPVLIVKDKILKEEKTNPSLSVKIENKNVFSVKNIEITAIIYDTSNSAINVSQSAIGLIEPQMTEEVTFTWPEAFLAEVSRVEIIPVVK